MLTLTRRIGEKLRINDEIEITVVDIDRGKVKLGIVAPKHIPIHREEVWVRIQEAKDDGPT